MSPLSTLNLSPKNKKKVVKHPDYFSYQCKLLPSYMTNLFQLGLNWLTNRGNRIKSMEVQGALLTLGTEFAQNIFQKK